MVSPCGRSLASARLPDRSGNFPEAAHSPTGWQLDSKVVTRVQTAISQLAMDERCADFADFGAPI